MKDASLLLDGRRIEAAWWGPAPDAAPTLVLLHEGLGSVSLWRTFPAALAAATGWGVFAYSRFGYGGSDPAVLPRPVAYMHAEAALLPAILDAAGIGRCILFGHSDGASIATLAAGDPRVTGLVLLAPHFFVEDQTIAGIEAARDAYASGRLRDRLAPHHADVDHAFRGWNDAWLNPAFRAWRIDEALPRLLVPLLIVQGETDAYGTDAQLELARGLAGGKVRTVLLPGCGHAPQQDRREAVLAETVAFIATHYNADYTRFGLRPRPQSAL